VPICKLVSPEGVDLGPFRTSVPNWEPGDVIPLGGGKSWRVERVLVQDDDEPVLEVVPG
jgi:hypothetical protein